MLNKMQSMPDCEEENHFEQVQHCNASYDSKAKLRGENKNRKRWDDKYDECMGK